MTDHAFERHAEPALPDRHETRQQLGHLHAREALLACLLVADEEAEAERETRDVRERLPGTNRERRQHREDVGLEDALELLQLVRLEVLDLRHYDALGRERRLQRPPPELRLVVGELQRAPTDFGERRARREAVRRAAGHPGRDLVHQAGHADHEELVHVRREDGAEIDPVEQRHRLVGGHPQHPSVEFELRELPVEKAGFGLDDARSHERPSSRHGCGPWVTKLGLTGYDEPIFAIVFLFAASTPAGSVANWSFGANFWPGPIAYVRKSRSACPFDVD